MDDWPLFAYKDKTGLWPLTENTINTKARREIQKVLGEETTHTSHDFRHAVSDMGVPRKTIGEHVAGE